jgi:[protein-PII] uridylyltransferase
MALYTPREKRTFAHATAVLDELGMTIMDARIVPLDKDRSIVTLVFMELDQRVESDEARINKIRRALTRILTAPNDKVASVTRTLPRQARMITTDTTVDFSRSTANDQTVLELRAADRPGLLSKIGQVFIEQGIDIEAAKIVTIGERAEDVFYVCLESGGGALDDSQQDQLGKALLEQLGSSAGK